MSHPYRQKASAPYPIDDLDQRPHSYPQQQDYDATQPLHEYTPSALDASTQFNTLPSMASPRFSGKVETGAYPGDRRSGRLTESPEPQPGQPVLSPPPVPMSATSSVTNLNLLHSKSRSDHQINDLAGAAAGYPRYSHTRSVSLVLSFFYDRQDASLVDFNQNVIHLYLGSNLNNLMPRMKTIEMYRKNAKKLSDPAVLFQYAQYMLQTALMVDQSPAGSGSTTPQPPVGSLVSLDEKTHQKLGSSLSFESADPQLKRNLLKEALHYLKRLADKGYVEAQYLLGDAYSSGAFGKVDNKEAFVLFLAAAKHGHTESAFRTAHCYEEGLGTGRDARKGLEFLKIAASKNHAAAMYKLGVYSFYGRMGLPDNVVTKKLGIKWLERALNVATELTAAAPYELGKIYFSGFMDILLKDEKYALELYAQAAALGHVEAAAILGHYYEVGELVPEDANLSIHYYTKAALGGHAEAMLAMCAWYLVGLDPYLPKDDGEAFEWAKRAAQCNLAKAQFALANFYDKGIGCIKNEAEAQTWYTKAAENGETKALLRIRNKEAAARLTSKSKTRKPAAQDKDCIVM